jgi:hypothetical protein
MPSFGFLIASAASPMLFTNMEFKSTQHLPTGSGVGSTSSNGVEEKLEEVEKRRHHELHE